ncbi:MAG: hypothetical protein HZA49_01460 [Planctomycetes bacterium]|nr:hypothetical protein [Planctomycetota bacterium]
MTDSTKIKLGLGLILAVGLIAGYYGCGGSSSSDSGSSAVYEALGITDTAFGTLGVVTTAISGGSAAYRVKIQPDGLIVTAGYANSRFALARFK